VKCWEFALKTAWFTIVTKDLMSFAGLSFYGGCTTPRVLWLLLSLPATPNHSQDSVDQAGCDRVVHQGTQHFTADVALRGCAAEAASSAPSHRHRQLRINRHRRFANSWAHGSGNARGHRNGSVGDAGISELDGEETRAHQGRWGCVSSRWLRHWGGFCQYISAERFEAREVIWKSRIPENQLDPGFVDVNDLFCVYPPMRRDDRGDSQERWIASHGPQGVKQAFQRSISHGFRGSRGAAR